jgi:hypothetical protein
MAYRAYIDAVRDNPVPSQNIFVAVRFQDDVSNPVRVIRQEYKYLTGTSRLDFTNMVLADRDALRALDAAKTVLVGAIGTEVT